MGKHQVSPSLISCDLSELGNQISQCEEAGADRYHLDVMDGHFVPNLTMGPDLVKAVRKCTDKPLEAHLMVERPDKFLSRFAEAGTDMFLLHQENLINFAQVFSEIQRLKLGAGIVINPETDPGKVVPYLDRIEMILVMSVHPGFSGQKFIESTPSKIRHLTEILLENSAQIPIEVDGGINDQTGRICLSAGASILVSASYIFSGVIGERIRILKNLRSE
ncbi:ribulose-phosphate 3-epimerase [Thermoplasmatales archaeon AK]|nr:ribulose-phosphate 3-epimerase [Thermoplasmatales archaeon AK]